MIKAGAGFERIVPFLPSLVNVALVWLDRGGEITGSLVIGQGEHVLMAKKCVDNQAWISGCGLMSGKNWIQGTLSPGLQVRVTLWPHCPERLNRPSE